MAGTAFILSLLSFAISVLGSPVVKSYHQHAPNNSTSFSWASTTALLAFGDSYTYVQGIYGYPNSTFIGSALNFSYTPEELLSDVIVQNETGTSAGGPNWVEYLTGCFEGLPAECGGKTYGRDEDTDEYGIGSGSGMTKELWDFAFGGADITKQFLTPHHAWSVDLVDQVRQWDTFARPYLPNNPATTLVAIWIGINDIDDSVSFTNISFSDFYRQDIARLFESVDSIRAAGYQNYLFMKLPPLDKTPGNVLRAAKNETTLPSPMQIAEWNGLLEDAAKNLSRTDGVENVFTFDTYDFLNGVINHAAEYGIMNVTGYCPEYDWPDIATNYTEYGCLPIPEYFWYNTGHITYHVHEILAKGVADFLKAQ